MPYDFWCLSWREYVLMLKGFRTRQNDVWLQTRMISYMIYRMNAGDKHPMSINRFWPTGENEGAKGTRSSVLVRFMERQKLKLSAQEKTDPQGAEVTKALIERLQTRIKEMDPEEQEEQLDEDDEAFEIGLQEIRAKAETSRKQNLVG